MCFALRDRLQPEVHVFKEGCRSMQITLGYNASMSERDQPVMYDTRQLINSHMIMAGDSGTGKTYNIRRFIQSMRDTAEPGSGARFHVVDVHGDIDIPGASTVEFNETSRCGFEPLKINPSPEFGGVRKCVQSFISNLKHSGSFALGPKQEATLRTLLYDLMAARGFFQEDPESWRERGEVPRSLKDNVSYIDVPYEEKDAARAAGARWDGEARCWYVETYEGKATRWPRKAWGKVSPSLQDAIDFAENRLKATFLGANQTAMRWLESLNGYAKRYHAKKVKLMKEGTLLEGEEIPEDMQKAAEKAIDAYTHYIKSIQTGRELEDLIKYDSVENLKSVIDRMRNLNSIGIFGSAPPNFSPDAPVWRYVIKSKNEDEKKLFVDFLLERIFYAAVERGMVSQVRDVIIVDEAKIFVSEDPDHIINKIIREARKFGIALILASQSPTHFPDDIISGVGTKVILGIDQFHWSMAQRKLGIEENLLRWIKPKSTIAVQMKRSGELSNKFIWTNLRPFNQGAKAEA